MLNVGRLVLYTCFLTVLGVLAPAWPAFAEPAATVLPSAGLIEALFPLEGYGGQRRVAAGPEDTLWFFISGPKGEPIISRLTPTGLINANFSIPLQSTGFITDEPTGLAVGSGGAMWFTVRSFDENEDSFIGRVTSGGRVSEFPLASESAYPAEIVGAPGGGAWFSELHEDKIVRVNEAGAIISEYNSPCEEASNLTLAPNGSLWFTSGTYAEQNLICHLGDPENITKFPIPHTPAGIAVASDGDVWFTSSAAGEVGKITPEGSVSEFSTPKVERPIALGLDGNMWFIDDNGGGGAITRIAAAGAITSFAPIPGIGTWAMVAGSDGDLWLVGWNDIDRFTIPYAPANTSLPSVLGESVAGQTLSATEGAWSNAHTFTYQWQRCQPSGEGCSDLSGEVAPTYALAPVDVGHTLRVIVNASGPGGSASATSATSRIVQPPPPSPPAQHQTVQETLPAVGATMTWRFGWSRTYTVMEALVVHDVPAGAQLEVSCRGRGCPFSHKRVATTRSARRCRGRRCSRACSKGGSWVWERACR